MLKKVIVRTALVCSVFFAFSSDSQAGHRRRALCPLGLFRGAECAVCPNNCVNTVPVCQTAATDPLPPITVEMPITVQKQVQEEYEIVGPDGVRRKATRTRSVTETVTKSVELTTANAQIQFLNKRIRELEQGKIDPLDRKVEKIEKEDVIPLKADVDKLKKAQ